MTRGRGSMGALLGMHSQKHFKEPSDVGIILHDQIKSKREKFIWHSGLLNEFSVTNYSA